MALRGGLVGKRRGRWWNVGVGGRVDSIARSEQPITPARGPSQHQQAQAASPPPSPPHGRLLPLSLAARPSLPHYLNPPHAHTSTALPAQRRPETRRTTTRLSLDFPRPALPELPSELPKAHSKAPLEAQIRVLYCQFATSSPGSAPFEHALLCFGRVRVGGDVN